VKYLHLVKYAYLFLIILSFANRGEAKIEPPKVLSHDKIVDMIQNGSPLYESCPEYSAELKQKYALMPHCALQQNHNKSIDMSLQEYAEYRGINSGNSLLHEAALVKNKNAIKACLKAGYNMDGRNSVDDTPWMIYGRDEWNRDFPDHKVPVENE